MIRNIRKPENDTLDVRSNSNRIGWEASTGMPTVPFTVSATIEISRESAMPSGWVSSKLRWYMEMPSCRLPAERKCPDSINRQRLHSDWTPACCG